MTTYESEKHPQPLIIQGIEGVLALECPFLAVDFLIYVVIIFITTYMRSFALSYIIENKSGKYTYLYEC